MEYVIFRKEEQRPGRPPVRRLAKSSDWYPRIVEANSPEMAVVRMFEDETGELRVAGTRTFVVIPMYEASVVEVSPRREFNFRTSPWEIEAL